MLIVFVVYKFEIVTENISTESVIYSPETLLGLQIRSSSQITASLAISSPTFNIYTCSRTSHFLFLDTSIDRERRYAYAAMNCQCKCGMFGVLRVVFPLAQS